MSFTFPALPYAYDALEPYIDARTMEIHHARHHRTYFDKFMAAINGTELETQSLPEIFAKVSLHSPAVRNTAVAITTTTCIGHACHHKVAECLQAY